MAHGPRNHPLKSLSNILLFFTICTLLLNWFVIGESEDVTSNAASQFQQQAYNALSDNSPFSTTPLQLIWQNVRYIYSFLTSYNMMLTGIRPSIAHIAACILSILSFFWVFTSIIILFAMHILNAHATGITQTAGIIILTVLLHFSLAYIFPPGIYTLTLSWPPFAAILAMIAECICWHNGWKLDEERDKRTGNKIRGPIL